MSTELSGSLLVATPALLDPNFRRTVVLMLDHGEDGALGVVLNRPSEVAVSSVLAPWAEHASAPGVLFHGGPVAQDSAIGLVRAGSGTMGWREVVGDLGLIDLDTPTELVHDALSALRIFVGYAGWGAGQLERELAEDAWWVFPAEPGDAFDADAEGLWPAVLRRQGGEPALAATLPDDPTMN
jgi:putative transcriptional regulator